MIERSLLRKAEAMLKEREREREREGRGEPRLRATRRGVSVETRPPARSLASSARGLEQARAGRSLARREGGAVARDKGGEWAAADASRDLLDGSGCTCERE